MKISGKLAEGEPGEIEEPVIKPTKP